MNKIETDISNEIDAVDLTQKDVDRAFWIWFGSMAFIISIIGSLVALAGFHLQDERMHEIRNKPIKARLLIGFFSVNSKPNPSQASTKPRWLKWLRLAAEAGCGSGAGGHEHGGDEGHDLTLH